MKVLFLPFLQMSSGHHAVADALIRSLEKRVYGVECKKIDFFSYADKLLEKAFRLTYLTWIDHSPQSFAKLYQNFVYPSNLTKQFEWYESKFLDKMKSLLQREQPDIIVCTQAFPSFLVSRLKYLGWLTVPVINVYTDFFINKLWGLESIDYHFVPDNDIKYQLINKNRINPERIFVTGIPIDECFTASRVTPPPFPCRLLVAGGNSGLGDLHHLLPMLANASTSGYSFSVLCGRNHKLYKEILDLNRPNIRALPYISSRDAMNSLYDESHGIITKPGGVTISEALYKKVPIFIHSSLPGQEEINKNQVLAKKLIIPLHLHLPIEAQLNDFYQSQTAQMSWLRNTEDYLNQLEQIAWERLIMIILQTKVMPTQFKEDVQQVY